MTAMRKTMKTVKLVVVKLILLFYMNDDDGRGAF